MTTEAKPKLTLQEKAMILQERGVDAYDWLEPEVVKPNVTMPLFPTIWFRGDENEGERAVKIMQEHDIYVYRLHRQWHYEGDKDPRSVCWVLVI